MLLHMFKHLYDYGVYMHVSIHSAKSLLYDTAYYSVYSNIRNISCLRIVHYKQIQFSQSSVVCGILANL